MCFPHRLESGKIRNVAKFFAHLIHSDALEWSIFGYVRITELDTTSSSRIFLKIVFLEMSEHLVRCVSFVLFVFCFFFLFPYLSRAKTYNGR